MKKGIKISEIKYTFPVARKENYNRPIIVRVEKDNHGNGVILLVAFFR
ncbi:hypothetical protein SAMN05660826_01186 [Caldanaerovirga acetigignens]|uniref:Uncharacterized protein n=1 Tax=Caldanaerovirga acetigignens TaxID=447595 RepID=A0A1M7JB38_9FIRM|nr:hypothetical protein SAMN05660826_01186 [Caldanaerovirga acetigignens]